MSCFMVATGGNDSEGAWAKPHVAIRMSTTKLPDRNGPSSSIDSVYREPSEREASGKLERPGTAGTERRTVEETLLRLAKRRAGEIEAIQGQVADIQDVESFADEPEFIAFV